MHSPRQALKLFVVLPLALIACQVRESEELQAGVLSARKLEAFPIVSTQAPAVLRWPQFFLVEGPSSFLWGGGQEILRIQRAEKGDFHVEEVAGELTQGMDRLIAAARSPGGTLAVLDASGEVALLQPEAGQVSKLRIRLPAQQGGLAVTEERVYLLLQGEPEEGSAVVAYTRSGAEAGRWGKQPVDAVIQESLSGGGIAACPDGSVFYTYINSPRILRLEPDHEGAVRALGKKGSAFQVLSGREVAKAHRDSIRTGSVKPLVTLGLSGSRVMKLLCSEDGLLLRQVAQPDGGGAHVEVWEPRSGELLGRIPVDSGVLLGSLGHILYLGTLPEGQRFTLERFQLEMGQTQTAETAR